MAHAGKGHKLLAAGTATLIAEPVFALAHQGALGVILGLAAGAAAYALIDDVEQVTGKHLSLPARQHRDTRGGDVRQPGKLSLAHRLLVGKSVREEAADENDDDLEPDEDEEEEEDILDTLELGELRPHVDTAFSNRIVILGMSGSGKSNLVTVLVEELGQYDAPLILLDHKPEYWPLCQQPYLSNPVRANAQNLTSQNAFAVGQHIMQQRLQVVVDLTSYSSDTEAALVMIGLIQGIERFQKALSNNERIPCTFVLDEAHYWLPENEALSTIRAAKHPKTGEPLLSVMQHTFFNLAKIGRYLGMGLVVATQRPADVDKQLISQAEWRFLLKAMEPADLKVYRTYGLSGEQAQELNPKQGEAYVIGPDESRGVYHIRRRFSPDVAKSPGLANIRNAPRGPLSDGDVSLTAVTPLTEPGEWGNTERRDADVDADARRERAEVPGQPTNVTTFPRTPAAEPVEPMETVSTGRQPSYQLTDREITAFLAAYRACGNRDKALASIGRGSSNYRECANRILRAYGLKEEA